MHGIDDLIAEIRSREEEKQAAAERIRTEAGNTLFDNGEVLEDMLLQDVAADPLQDVTVAGIDGGCVRKAFHGIDLIMVRAVAAVCNYEDGSLAGTRYHPSTSPRPRLEHITENLPRSAVDQITSLNRLQEEVGVAADIVADTDIMLLDGSLLPQYPDRPGQDTEWRSDYESLLEQYQELYTAAGDGVLLAGVVEDTRSSAMCQVLQANGFTGETVQQCRDTTLLDYLMKKGERTLVMPYGDSQMHAILSDLSPHGDAIHSFYLKTVKNDRPIRVDMYAPTDQTRVADEIAGIIYSLAGINDAYGIPAPIIEADQRAKLNQHEIDLVTRRIQSKLAHLSATESLRRERRPF